MRDWTVGGPTTIGQLREALSQYSDDVPVVVSDWDTGERCYNIYMNLQPVDDGDVLVLGYW